MRTRAAGVLLLAVVASVAGALWTLDAGTRRSASAFAAGSVFNDSPEGLSLAWRYLRERSFEPGASRPVTILSRRLAGAALPPNAVLFRLRPRRLPFPASAEETKRAPDAQKRPVPPLLTVAEDAWVRSGGRLVLGLDGAYGPITCSPLTRTEPVHKVFPAWASARVLQPEGPLPLLGGPPLELAHAIFASGPAPVLSRLPLGRGDVLVLAVPSVLENARLARADHLRLLEALVETGRPIAFDEWTHGYGEDSGLLSLLLAWGFGPSLLAATLAFGLALWRGRTRIGPAEADLADVRSEAVDLVDSLSQLYDRALTRKDALALHADGLRAAVALRSGARGETLERRVRELQGGEPPSFAGDADLTPPQFRRALHLINEGYRRLEEHAHPRPRP